MIKRPDTNAQRLKRHKRVRAKLSGTPERPRLNVFRSEKNIYAQIIDDVAGNTLVAASSLDKEIEELEDERSAVSSRLKKQIDAKEAERREMSAHVNDGELRTFSCDCLKDYATGEMVWTEMHPPYAEVNRRKMTKEEMQPSLLEYSEKIDASAPVDEMDFDALAEVAAEEGDAFTAGGMDDESNEAPEVDAEPGEAEDEAPAGDNPETEEQEVA